VYYSLNLRRKDLQHFREQTFDNSYYIHILTSNSYLLLLRNENIILDVKPSPGKLSSREKCDHLCGHLALVSNRGGNRLIHPSTWPTSSPTRPNSFIK